MIQQINDTTVKIKNFRPDGEYPIGSFTDTELHIYQAAILYRCFNCRLTEKDSARLNKVVRKINHELETRKLKENLQPFILSEKTIEALR